MTVDFSKFLKYSSSYLLRATVNVIQLTLSLLVTVLLLVQV